MSNLKGNYILTALAIVLALVAGFFGLKYPAPAMPEPLPAADGVSMPESRAVVDRYWESLYVDKELVSAGSTTVGASIVAEGATADAYETTLAITDPTADRTITFPNSTGTVALNPYGASIEFEGTTADAYETTLTVVDPTADRTVTIPNETGAVMMSSLATNGTAITNSVTGGTNALVWEGATADAYELSLSATDPTADRSVVLPDAAGTVMLSSLATNGADAANAVTGASNALVFEGATANDYETSVSSTDPTADRSVVLPDAGGTVMLSSLATNGADAANAVTGASNSLVLEGATADDYETSITPTDPTADRTLTLPDLSGTVHVNETTQALTANTGAFSGDVTVSPVSDGGNAGAKNEISGLPRIKLIGLEQGTNPASDTVDCMDATPTGEWTEVDAGTNLAITADTSTYKADTNSILLTVGTVAENDGVTVALPAQDNLTDIEYVGFWVYSDEAITSGDLDLTVDDSDGTDQVYTIGAVSASVWTWVEVDISACGANCDTTDNFLILFTAQGAINLTDPNIYIDELFFWDDVDEEALGTTPLQDGVLSVVDTEGGATLAEWTDYIVAGSAIVYITDQSAADVMAMVAY